MMKATKTQIDKDLKRLYASIPETEGCSENLAKGDDGCKAWCCSSQNPQLTSTEFQYAWTEVENSWSEDNRIALLKRCIENYLSNAVTKGCVFWNRETRFCNIHRRRPFNCRIYAQTPDEEFKPRFEKLKILYPDSDIKDQCNLCQTKGKKPTVQDTDDWFKEVKWIEMSAGVHPQNINSGQNGTYLTFHDHILLSLCGASLLMEMTKMKLKGTDEQKVAFVERITKTMRKHSGTTT
jgi:Fe-S-cluster containining protein